MQPAADSASRRVRTTVAALPDVQISGAVRWASAAASTTRGFPQTWTRVRGGTFRRRTRSSRSVRCVSRWWSARSRRAASCQLSPVGRRPWVRTVLETSSGVTEARRHRARRPAASAGTSTSRARAMPRRTGRARRVPSSRPWADPVVRVASSPRPQMAGVGRAPVPGKRTARVRTAWVTVVSAVSGGRRVSVPLRRVSSSHARAQGWSDRGVSARAASAVDSRRVRSAAAASRAARRSVRGGPSAVSVAAGCPGPRGGSWRWGR